MIVTLASAAGRRRPGSAQWAVTGGSAGVTTADWVEVCTVAGSAGTDSAMLLSSFIAFASLLEDAHRLAQPAGGLGQLLRAEQQDGDERHDQQVPWFKSVAEHGLALSTVFSPDDSCYIAQLYNPRVDLNALRARAYRPSTAASSR